MQTWSSSVQCHTSLMFRTTWPNGFDLALKCFRQRWLEPFCREDGHLQERSSNYSHHDSFFVWGGLFFFFFPKVTMSVHPKKTRRERKGEEGSAERKGAKSMTWETHWWRRPTLPPAGCSALPCCCSHGLAVQQPHPFTLLQHDNGIRLLYVVSS